ncbi:MAG TPA: polyhydroxyalkanoate synthesis regulator DNA-binding domain-containing protein [Candidatus Acidoferrum sp.]|nr:polyhydroxyalkanoate synthesis regulator DNA-binding domain-containing protein [Candidatus Acidoferrum sp.]
MNNPDVLIRKYSDRRLYDTGASRYVKLADIARMVRDGRNVRIEDGRTGKDLTHIVLTQIIVEDAKDQKMALPLQLLTQLVRASDKATHNFLSWYLDSTFDMYQKAQKGVDTGLSEAKRAVASPLDFVGNLLTGQLRPPPRPSGEVDQLRREVEELKARLAQPKKSAPRAKKRKRRA